MDEKTTDLKFIETVVGFLVEHPESIKISRIVDEMGVLLTLDVHPDDMRQVIGREGNTAKAIRTLLRVVGMKSNARVNLKINEPEGAAPRAPRMERPMDRHSNNRGGFSDRGGYNRPRYDREDRGGSADDHGYAN